MSALAREVFPLADDPRNMASVLQKIHVEPHVAEQFSHIKLPFVPRENQLRAMQAILYWPTMGLFDEPRCFPGETEFLTPTGWKRFDSYSSGDLIGQVDPITSEVSFVQPEKYVQSFDDSLVYFESYEGDSPVLKFCATADHKLLAYEMSYDKDGCIAESPVVCTASDIQSGRIKDHHLGFKNTFKVERQGIPLSNEEIRLMVAVIADGHFPNRTNSVIIRIKKQRKKDRLDRLLLEAGVEAVKKTCLPDGFHCYRFKAPRHEKHFTEFWWDASEKQLQVIVKEAEFWDGSRSSTTENRTGKKTWYQFSTSVKESADFIQYAAAACGRTAALSSLLRVREGRKSSTEFCVSIRDIGSAYTVRKRNISVIENPDPENRVYCFTVPSGFLVTRHRGRIVLTGNCGKSMAMQVTSIYFSKYLLRSLFVMPPVLFDQFQSEFDRIENHGCSVQQFAGTPKWREEKIKQWNREQEPAFKPSSWEPTPDGLILTREIFKKHVFDLAVLGYRVLYFDECHMGLQSSKKKNPVKKKAVNGKIVATGGSTTTYGSVKKFAETVVGARLILSTGSPVSNRVEQTYPIISLKSPGFYASERDFMYQHVTYKQITVRTPVGNKLVGVPDPDNYRNMEKLHQALYDKAVRALKAEVLNLDDPNIQIVPIKLCPTHYKLYRKVMTDKLAEVEGDLIDARQQAKLRVLALQMLINPSVVSDKPPESLVLEGIKTLFDSIDVHANKVVVFAEYNLSVQKLCSHFSYLHPATVYGPNGSEKNREEVKRFRENKECRILVANPIAGGVGLTLGDICQTVIVAEPISVPGKFDQAVSRVILAGQTSPAAVYVVSIPGTVSEKMTSNLLDKANQALEVTKDRRTVLDELLGRK